MPGGYQSEKGLDQGAIVLSRSAAFKAFVITDKIAMAVSSCSVLVLLYSSVYTNPNYENGISDTFFRVVSSILWALIAMVVSFITVTYAVLDGWPFYRTRHSGFCVWLLFLLVLANSLLSNERKILKGPHFLNHMFSGLVMLIAKFMFTACSEIRQIAKLPTSKRYGSKEN
ncbi:hypothetical protein ACFX11_027128 [Malus domestica]